MPRGGAGVRVDLARDDLTDHVVRQIEEVLVACAAFCGLGHGSWVPDTVPRCIIANAMASARFGGIAGHVPLSGSVTVDSGRQRARLTRCLR